MNHSLAAGLRAIAVAALLMTLASAPAADVASWKQFEQRAPKSERSDEWIIRIEPGRDAGAVAERLGYSLVRATALSDFHVIRIPDSAALGKRAAGALRQQLKSSPDVVEAEQIVEQPIMRMQVPTDPLYASQWHLTNTGQSGGTAGEDVDIVDAWNAGLTGAGVVIGVVDDGVEYVHPDLGGYDAARSYDYNADVADGGPKATSDAHGTAVAGIAGADADTKCGAGAAFGAALASQRIFGSNSITQEVIGDALANSRASNTGPDSLDVSNNSWGYVPNTLVSMPPYVLASMEGRVNEGRGGLGWIYVFSNGNGHQASLDAADWSGAEALGNLRYTIAVAATDHDGNQSSYSEGGPNIHVNAPSSGDGVGTTTTDRLGGSGYGGVADPDCTNGFGGTSSAAPLTAGIIALMLEANPLLHWRDVQYILAETAERNDPDDPSWQTNGAGIDHSDYYGFGRVNASAAVLAASDWSSLPDPVSTSSGTIVVNTPIPDAGGFVPFEHTFVDTPIARLEHVEVTINATTTYRGDTEILLTSPGGRTTMLMKRRSGDSGQDWNDWTFMATGFWGEDPDGTWTLEVRDAFGLDNLTFGDYEITLHGLAERTVGGTVSGLAGTGLVLQLNGADDLAIGADGAFEFPGALTDGSDYEVTVLDQPSNPGQTCSVANGSGMLDGADVADVAVTCTTDTFTVGGTVSGLVGSGLVLQLNGADDLAIGADGPFEFPGALTDGSDYEVTVAAQPGNPIQTCSVANGSGTLAGAGVVDVTVECEAGQVDLAIEVVQDASQFPSDRTLVHTITVTNLGPNDAVDARLFNAVSAGFDPASWTCQAAAGAICPVAAGTGPVDLQVTIPVGASLTVEWVASAASGFEGLVTHAIEIQPPSSLLDPAEENNVARAEFQTDAVFKDSFE